LKAEELLQAGPLLLTRGKQKRMMVGFGQVSTKTVFNPVPQAEIVSIRALDRSVEISVRFLPGMCTMRLWPQGCEEKAADCARFPDARVSEERCLMAFSADFLEPDTVYVCQVAGHYENSTSESEVRFFRTAETLPVPEVTRGAWSHAAQYLICDLAVQNGGDCQVEIESEWFLGWRPATRVRVQSRAAGVFRLAGTAPCEHYRARVTWTPPASQCSRGPSEWLEFDVPFSPPADWQLLGIDALEMDTISLQELGRCYKRQALKYHPDKGGDEETFKQLQETFASLRAKAFARQAGTDIAQVPCREEKAPEHRPQAPCRGAKTLGCSLSVARRGISWLAFSVVCAPEGAVLCVAAEGSDAAVRGDVNNGLETFVSGLAPGTKYHAWVELACSRLASLTTWTHGEGAPERATVHEETAAGPPSTKKGKKKRVWARFDDEDKGFILDVGMGSGFNIEGDRLSATVPPDCLLCVQYFDAALDTWSTAATLEASSQTKVPMRYGSCLWRAICVCTAAVELSI
jgi:hypothetical protein